MSEGANQFYLEEPLLNSLYKLVSGCIAERIKPNLDSIIHPDQKGFVSGRYIGEAVRTTYDLMQ